MDYVKLGASGVKVSKLCLGMMSYGTAGWPHHPWVLSEADAQPFLKGALDAGINFFDTADFYSAGASEEILGNFVNANMKRSDAVIATKVCLTMGDGPNDKGLSRKHIMEAIDASLARLKTDYVDLLYIHRLDHDTPMEEMAEALNDVVRSGRALYLAHHPCGPGSSPSCARCSGPTAGHGLRSCRTSTIFATARKSAR
jgi:aryl-alcohol dehydrogenase-like predicted oxidoreductase